MKTILTLIVFAFVAFALPATAQTLPASERAVLVQTFAEEAQRSLGRADAYQTAAAVVQSMTTATRVQIAQTLRQNASMSRLYAMIIWESRIRFYAKAETLEAIALLIERG